MKEFLLPIMLLVAACSPSKDSRMLHSVEIDHEGPRLFDYELKYGEKILPKGEQAREDFDGGGIYMSEMPLPKVATVSWRTAPETGGKAVRFVVPIRDQVTEEEWAGKFFTLRFLSTQTTLKVYAENKITPKHSRLIYSSGE